MGDVLRKWTLQEKYVEYPNFLTHFGFSLSLECPGEIYISRKSAYPPCKFARSGCIPPKIKCEILTRKHS